MAKERKKITAQKKLSIEEQEKTLQELHKKDRPRKVQRVTVDFPIDIYEEMKAETEKKGHTLKWFIVNLVKQYLADK